MQNNSLYRPNVAGILIRQDGKILVCERATQIGAWQFPQGGIDPGETALHAAYREIQEEVGFAPDQYTVLQSRAGYKYDYPHDVLEYVHKKRKQPYIGQCQEYFLCRLKQGNPVPIPDQREFRAYRWILPDEFELAWLPDFKKTVYRQVMRDFFNVELT